MQVSRILSTSLTAESQLSLGDDFLGIYLGAQRARTRWLGCTKGGGGEEAFWRWPTFPALLLSQVTDPPRIVQADFTIYSAVRESTSEGEKVWQIFRPKENFGRHTIHLPGHLDYHLIWRLYWSFSTFTMLVGFGKRQIRPHEGTWCNDLEGRPKLSKSQLPCKQLFTARCRTFLQGVGVLTTTKGRGKTYIVLQLSSSRYMPTGNIWWSKLQPDIFQHDLIRVGLWRIVKVQPLRDMNMMKISLLWTGCPDWSGAGAGSSEPGFHVRGTVPKCKKCMGTLNPKCFPADTWILLNPKISVQIDETQSSEWHT